MKTTKKLIVLCLILVMGIVAIMPSTFSWYDHNGSHTGNTMNYHRINLPVSAGSISVVTKKYRTVNNKLYYDEKGNKEYDGNAISSGSVASGAVQYYGTTFTNTGASPAYVNLYLKNFTNKPENHIGTLAPSLTYKGISSSVHLANKSAIRVYFQFKNATNGWSASGAKRYVVYKTKSGTQSYKEITSNLTAAESGTALRTRQDNVLGSSNIADTYYVDLPDHTTEFFFATDAANSGFSTSTLTTTQSWYRTRTITNIQAEKGYYLTGSADDTTWNAQYASFDIPGGISVMTYFDTLTINKNQRAYISLTEGTNFTGQSVSYARESGSSAITVNSNNNLVTASSSLETGDNIAVIRTTITGSMGDTTYVDTNVSNPTTISSAQVSLNIEIPGVTQDDDGNDVNGTAEVVWYIDNQSSADCSFASLYYTK